MQDFFITELHLWNTQNALLVSHSVLYALQNRGIPQEASVSLTIPVRSKDYTAFCVQSNWRLNSSHETPANSEQQIQLFMHLV